MKPTEKQIKFVDDDKKFVVYKGHSHGSTLRNAAYLAKLAMEVAPRPITIEVRSIELDLYRAVARAANELVGYDIVAPEDESSKVLLAKLGQLAAALAALEEE